MFVLIGKEIKKISHTRTFYVSFIAMLMSPIFALMLMSFQLEGFIPGDFTRLNILLLSLLGTRTFIPYAGMFLMKLELDQGGFESAFIMPIPRNKWLMSKVLTGIIWSFFLVLVSAISVVITEFILFSNGEILQVLIDSHSAYFELWLYGVSVQMLGMLMVIVFNNIIIPMVILITMIFVGYFMQLLDYAKFLPSVLPEYISGRYVEPNQVFMAWLIAFATFIISYFILRLRLNTKDY